MCHKIVTIKAQVETRFPHLIKIFKLRPEKKNFLSFCYKLLSVHVLLQHCLEEGNRGLAVAGGRGQPAPQGEDGAATQPSALDNRSGYRWVVQQTVSLFSSKMFLKPLRIFV